MQNGAGRAGRRQVGERSVGALGRSYRPRIRIGARAMDGLAGVLMEKRRTVRSRGAATRSASGTGRAGPLMASDLLDRRRPPISYPGWAMLALGRGFGAFLLSMMPRITR